MYVQKNSGKDRPWCFRQLDLQIVVFSFDIIRASVFRHTSSPRPWPTLNPSPEGPCTQIGCSLAPKYPNRDYFRAKVKAICQP